MKLMFFLLLSSIFSIANSSIDAIANSSIDAIKNVESIDRRIELKKNDNLQKDKKLSKSINQSDQIKHVEKNESKDEKLFNVKTPRQNSNQQLIETLKEQLESVVLKAKQILDVIKDSNNREVLDDNLKLKNIEKDMNLLLEKVQTIFEVYKSTHLDYERAVGAHRKEVASEFYKKILRDPNFSDWKQLISDQQDDEIDLEIED